MSAREELRLRFQNDMREALKPFTHYSVSDPINYERVKNAVASLLNKYRDAVGSTAVDHFRLTILADVSKGKPGGFRVFVKDTRHKLIKLDRGHIREVQGDALIIEWPFVKEDDLCAKCDGRGVFIRIDGQEADCAYCDGTGIADEQA